MYYYLIIIKHKSSLVIDRTMFVLDLGPIFWWWFIFLTIRKLRYNNDYDLNFVTRCVLYTYGHNTFWKVDVHYVSCIRCQLPNNAHHKMYSFKPTVSHGVLLFLIILCSTSFSLARKEIANNLSFICWNLFELHNYHHQYHHHFKSSSVHHHLHDYVRIQLEIWKSILSL